VSAQYEGRDEMCPVSTGGGEVARFKLGSAGALPRAEATLTHGERGRTKGSAAFEKAMQVLARMEQAST
jgi:hypothetical protein